LIGGGTDQRPGASRGIIAAGGWKVDVGIGTVQAGTTFHRNTWIRRVRRALSFLEEAVSTGVCSKESHGENKASPHVVSG
jgi:hypothetical protein